MGWGKSDIFQDDFKMVVFKSFSLVSLTHITGLIMLNNMCACQGGQERHVCVDWVLTSYSEVGEKQGKIKERENKQMKSTSCSRKKLY